MLGYMHTYIEGGSKQLSSDPPSLYTLPQAGPQKSLQKDNDHCTVPLNLSFSEATVTEQWQECQVVTLQIPDKPPH